MFVGVLKAIKGGKIEVEQKKSFLPDIHRVNMGLRGLGCGQYKRTTFKGFLCIFLKILAKDMGKPLVPAVPRHLGHLGHPNLRYYYWPDLKEPCQLGVSVGHMSTFSVN